MGEFLDANVVSLALSPKSQSAAETGELLANHVYTRVREKEFRNIFTVRCRPLLYHSKDVGVLIFHGGRSTDVDHVS